MTVYHTVDFAILLVELAVNVSFNVATWSIRINGAGIGDVVLHHVLRPRDIGWRHISGHNEDVRF